MNRIFISLLVFSMASMANAGVVISYNGATDVSEITISINTTVTIDIWNAANQIPNDFYAYLDFYPSNLGLYSLGNARLGPAAGNYPAFFNYANYGTREEYAVLQKWGTPPPPEVIGAIFLVDLHCEAIGDVQIELYDTRVGAGDTIVDSLIIHQVPEPATLLLLGLGAAIVRKRR